MMTLKDDPTETIVAIPVKLSISNLNYRRLLVLLKTYIPDAKHQTITELLRQHRGKKVLLTDLITNYLNLGGLK